MKKIKYVFILLLLLGICSYSLSWAGIIKRDDFQDQKSWWDWGSACTSFPSVFNGVAYLIQELGYSNVGCGTYLWDGENIYEYYTANIRVKTLTPMRPGTRGWGFWDYHPPITPYETADADVSWFMEQYDPFDSSQTWWLAFTRNGVTMQKNAMDLEPIVDSQEWHTYTIERREDYVAFSVDGTLVHLAESALPGELQSFHLWIDNFIYPLDDPTVPITYREISNPSSLVVDFVEIYDGQLGGFESPEGSLLLKEMPNETGSGESNFLWKQYTFASPTGKALVLITARVEQYGAFSDDDDIRIVVDDFDLGWDTATSFDGEVLNGKNRSLVYSDSFEQGDHSLKIYGDITPILYDITVIGAENGDIILDEELNEQAPGGSNYLWKDYLFNCSNNEEVSIFISASAHENSGDDDDIRIVLDSEDFGWNTNHSFSGDQLHGEARAIVIRRNLSSGEHRLRIYADASPTLHNVIVYGAEELSLTNQPPVLDPIGNKTVMENELLEFTVTASDPDGDNVTCSASNLPAGATFDPASQVFSWTPTYDQSGSYPNVLFTATDDGTPPSSDSEEITISVGDANRPPVLDPIGNKSVNEGNTLTFTITATDPDEDNLTYSASNLPAGASFDPATQIFSWTPGNGQAGNYEDVLFIVTDDGVPPSSDSEEITITVGGINQPPVLDPIGNKSVSEGDTLTFTITASDPDGDNLTYSASNLPTGASFDPATQVFSWTPGYGQAGNYEDVVFTVTDDGFSPLSDSESITISVGDINRPPVLDPIGNKSVNEGNTLTFTVTGTDPDGDRLTYSASNLPAGSTFDPATQVFSWTPGDGQADTYQNVLFTVTDNGTPPSSDSEGITITVEERKVEIIIDNVDPEFEVTGSGWSTATNPPYQAIYGSNCRYNVSGNGADRALYTFDVPVAAVYEVYAWWPSVSECSPNTPYLIPFSDGTVTVRVNQQQNQQQWNLLATGFFELGQHRIVISDDASATIVVADAVKIVSTASSNNPPVLDPIGNKTVMEDELLEFTVTATDPDGDNVTCSASNLPAGATFDPASQVFRWTPAYDQSGSYPNVMFTATDDGTPPSSDSEEITIFVGDANRPPVLDPIGNKSVNEGDTLSFTVTASDPDGDPLTYSSSNLPTGATFNPGTQEFIWSPDIGQAGNYTTVFSVTDDGDPPLNDTEVVTITVSEFSDPPVANDQSVTTFEDTPVPITLTATDGNGDPLTYAVLTAPANGTLTGAAPNLTYTPNADYNGTDSFTFKANNGQADSNIATVSIIITAVNDAPVASDNNYSVNEGNTLSVGVPGVLGNDNDVDGGTLTAVLVAEPTNGTLTLNSNGSFTYNPESQFIGMDSFTYQANDGMTSSNVATVTITVESVSQSENLMHVNAIEVTKGTFWILRYGIARVQVVDTEGSPIEGAVITGQWSGGASDTDQFTTGPDGWGTTNSGWRWGDATFMLCVTEISKADWEYDPDANALTCGSTD